jgi:hypothetical protein
MYQKIKVEKGDYIPKRVLGVHPHNDDIEAQCSRTLYRWAKGGAKIKIINTIAKKEGGAWKWEKKIGEYIGYEGDFSENAPYGCQ